MEKIAASIMCGNQLALGQELQDLEAAGIDWLHCDVMDGVYVDNLAMAPYVLEPIIQTGKFTTDIHLACVDPEKYIEMFAPLAPDYLTFHIETTKEPATLLKKIHDKGIKAGIALNPETPIEMLFPYLDSIELILVMTVNPGFAGQKFQLKVLEKIKRLNRQLETSPIKPLIEVDGNINSVTAPAISKYGANLYVVGTSALFNEEAGSYREKVMKLKQSLVTIEKY
ncbi:ribulose-phosphate 3-epimerase [Enterococcus raffinosus]|uniref:ribulose-phosphate 3-epimerase n=1 Tax=Enterococcus raffinosus TaxID=71452 RepID=UPI001C0F56F4|nr:ribulose-phosphate 3-epimerase [Enterococcus raffinosus]MBU5360802.1 ribulose-phosphate 3-epimerase [Enterococcus raffinosus]